MPHGRKQGNTRSCTAEAAELPVGGGHEHTHHLAKQQLTNACELQHDACNSQLFVSGSSALLLSTCRQQWTTGEQQRHEQQASSSCACHVSIILQC